MPTTTTSAAIGKAPDDLTLTERAALAGKYMALEIYTPTLMGDAGGKPEIAVRLRRIEAIGDTPEECIRQLQAAGADPAGYEFTRLKPPFGGLA
jgi:hypothetical protein